MGTLLMANAPGRSRGWFAMAATIISSGIGNFATILATALLVRHFGQEAFGRVALLSSSALALATTASAGIGLYVVRAGATAEEGDGSSLRAAQLFGHGMVTVCGIGLLVVGPIAGEISLLDCLCAAVAMQLITSDALSKNRLISRQQVLPLAQATLAGALCAVALQLAGAYAWGPTGYLLGFTVGTATQAALSRMACRRNLEALETRSLQTAIAHLRDPAFRSFVWPATVSASLVPLAHWAANLIAAAKSGRYADVAVLTVAMQFFNIVIFTPTVLNKIVLPRTILRYRKASAGQDQRHTLQQALWTLVLTAPAPMLCWLLSEQIATLYRFTDPAMVAVVLGFTVASVFACASIPVSNYLVSHAQMNLGLLTNVFWAALYIGTTLLAPGAAVAVSYGVMLAYGANLALALWFVMRQDGPGR